jgi:hypothetical protein
MALDIAPYQKYKKFFSKTCFIGKILVGLISR